MIQSGIKIYLHLNALWLEENANISFKGWVAQGREIFDQDEEGKIAELEVCGKTQSSDKKLRTGNFHCFRRSLRENEQVRETFDLKNISPGAKFPDESCPALRFYKDYVYRVCPSFVLDLKEYLRY